MITVEWTGEFPCLCHGEWIIKYNDINLTVPQDVQGRPMNTFGEYSRWEFNEDFEEEWDIYTDGLDKQSWININIIWISNMFNEHNIKVTDELLSELYNKIQENDWRHESCGGCI